MVVLIRACVFLYYILCKVTKISQSDPIFRPFFKEFNSGEPLGKGKRGNVGRKTVANNPYIGRGPRGHQEVTLGDIKFSSPVTSSSHPR